MPRETWAVHSVRDHMTSYPFVGDVHRWRTRGLL